jgi:hypothetical protein
MKKIAQLLDSSQNIAMNQMHRYRQPPSNLETGSSHAETPRDPSSQITAVLSYYLQPDRNKFLKS